MSAERFAALLTTRWLGRAARLCGECGSTNDEAAAWARAGAAAGACVIAESQTRGRGRLGRTWHSPPGESLYLSVVLRPDLPPRALPPLTLAAGVALAEAVGELAAGRAPVELKWPNDLLVGGKKAAGILTEMACAGDRAEHVVVGIGLNLNGRAFPPELAERATSLALACGGSFDRLEAAARVCGRLEAWYERFAAGGTADVVAAFGARAAAWGRAVMVDGEHVGHAAGLDPDGALRVRRSGGDTVRLLAGELSLEPDRTERA